MALIKKDSVEVFPGRPRYHRGDSYHQHFPAWQQIIKDWKLNHGAVYQPWLDFLTFADWAKDQPNAWAMYPDGPIDFRMKSPLGGWFPENCHFVRMSYEEREERERRKKQNQIENKRTRENLKEFKKFLKQI